MPSRAPCATVRAVLQRRVIAWGALALASAFTAGCSSAKSGGSDNAGGFIGSAEAGAAGAETAGAGGDTAQPGMPTPEGGPGPGTPCNGSPALCGKSFSELAFLGTHLSMASDESWPTQTQGRGLADQLLSGGVRALELEVHEEQGALALCEGDCALASDSLTSVLRDLATFMTQNSTEVVTLVLRSAVSPDALVAAFNDQRLVPLANTQQPGKPWPTLQQMIDDNRRLVVLLDQLPTDADGGAPETALPTWLHALSDWAWETAPSEASTCVIASGDAKSPLAILNHYVPGEGSADKGLAAAHLPAAITARLDRCRDDRKQAPNFVFVDFAEVGDPNGGVQIENGGR